MGRTFRIAAAAAAIVSMHVPVQQVAAQSTGAAAPRRPVTTPAPARTGKKAAAPAQPAGPTAAPKIGTINDLCRVREREILFHAGNVLALTADYRKETDPAKKDALLRSLQNEKQFAGYVEQSWERLSCQLLLYGSPSLGNGR